MPHPKPLSACPRALFLALMAVLMVGPLYGCGDAEPPQAEAPEGDTSNTTQAQAAKPAPPAKPPPHPAEGFVAKADQWLTSEAIQAHMGGSVLQDAIEREAGRERKRRRSPFKQGRALKDLYLSDPGLTRPHMVQGAGLSPTGEHVLSVLKASWDHALSPSNYHVKTIERDLGKLKRSLGKSAELKIDPLSPTEREALVKALKASGIDVAAPDARDRALKLMLGPGAPVARVREAANRWGDAYRDAAQDVAMVELLLADGLLHYAWDQRFQNEAWFPDIDFGDMRPAERRRALRAQMVKAATAAFKQGTITDWADELPPHHPQYMLLHESLKRYRAVHEKGGWEKVKRFNVGKGVRSKRVVELKRRLNLEGFYPPGGGQMESNPSEKVNSALLQAVDDYLVTHQMDVKRGTRRAFWTSLNMSTERRIEQIKLTMDRWRESRIGNDDRYVFVNIPDFHAEVWKDGQRQMRFRIVVGNTQYGCDINDKRWKLINATPLQSRLMRKVIVNPYWNVPERIWKEEIKPLAKEDPTYYERNNYECMPHKGEACGRIRQAGGDGNALGRVKFIFPNKHNTYMHDTPKKHFFKYPVRAYSHGCMRVHEPLKLAEHLLNEDGQWDERDFNRKLGGKKEYAYHLNAPLPVHIEYYTVRVDDNGHVNFLSDVYKYDRARAKGEEVSYRRCTDEELAYARDPAQDDLDEDENAEGAEGAEGDDGGDAKTEGGERREIPRLLSDVVTNNDGGSNTARPIPTLRPADGNGGSGGAASGLKPKLRTITIPKND